jgi:TorA maturation chaperone TorD
MEGRSMSHAVSAEPDEAPEGLRAQAAGWRFLADLLAEVPRDARIQQARAFLAGLGMDGGSEDDGQIRADFLQLFVGLKKTLAPPWESAYLTPDRQVMQTPTLAVRRAYLQAGLSHPGMFQIPDDHISLELEFLAALAERTAQALEGNQLEAADEARIAREHFLDEHLGRWAGAFVADIQAHANTSFWRGVGAVLQEVVASAAPGSSQQEA